jgi:3'(2'), 5'-bisphosphate nucleotidase
VCLALIVDGQVRVGIMGCPNLPAAASDERTRGCLFVAVEGQHAYQVRPDAAVGQVW